MGTAWLLASGNPLNHVVAHELFRIGPVPVNTHMVMMTLAAVLLGVGFPLAFRKSVLVPSGLRNFVETVCVYFRDEMIHPLLRDHTDRFAPYIWTLFFFILACNLLGMLPLAAVLYFVSLGRLRDVGGAATGNIYVTGALAGLTFIIIHASGIWYKAVHQHKRGRPWPQALVVGFLLYFYKMVPHVDGILGIVLFPFLLALEVLGGFVKCMALAIRLFANMVGGHIVLAVLLTFIAGARTIGAGVLVAGGPVLGSVALSLLELFVAFLQAYIFAFLATLFIGMAVHQEH